MPAVNHRHAGTDRAPSLLVIVLLSLAPLACGDAPPPVADPDADLAGVPPGTLVQAGDCDPAAAICSSLLRTTWTVSEAIELATGDRYALDEGAPFPSGSSAPGSSEPAATADLKLSLGRFLFLQGARGHAICSVGAGYSSPSEIPLDDDSCAWTQGFTFGVLTDPYQGPVAEGLGLLVRDAAGEVTYRVLITRDDVAYTKRVDEESGEAVMEYLGELSFTYATSPLPPAPPDDEVVRCRG